MPSSRGVHVLLLVAVLALLQAGAAVSADAEGDRDSARQDAEQAKPLRAPVVETRAGRISGKVLTSDGGRQYYAYLGVPYAKPPVGDLRFKFPRRFKEKEWEGVRRCDTDPPKCPQLSYPERHYEGDEDCLYLNVYTHKTEETKGVDAEELVTRLRAVLVWLHGGNFQHGSGTFDDVGPERFMDAEEDIVLVVPNYRLNALGFLSVGEHPAVGNAGMKDVFTVLSWVQGHIARFGGHPGRVTLGGHQAGAAAAHLHALSPLSSHEPDLFRQTLSLSGNALAPWAVLPTAEARRRALKLARALGCAKKSVPDEKVDAPAAVRCLRTKPAEDVVKASNNVLDWSSDLSFPFVPSVERFDGHNRPFMIVHPEEMLGAAGGSMRGAKTWVAGVTTHDGLPQALQLMVFRGMLADLNERFEEVIWKYLGMEHVVEAAGPEARAAAARRLRDHYLPGQLPITLDTLSGLVDLTSDALYYHSLHRAVRLHAEGKRTPALVYRFGFDRHEDRTHVLGVPLGTDVELLFPAIFAGEKSKLLTKEKEMSKKLLRLLANFVSIGDPTPDEEPLLDNILWPPAKDSNYSFLDIDLKGKISVNESGFYVERIALWDAIFEDLHQTLRNSEPKSRTVVSDQAKDEL
ncbi:Venom carboxylesterase-6 [Frankliniella fusca]|uniref:Venom carboxylesterase-6 n=1 Tax=Frankliniella fusca TaxID=407009 RepID=A0AAE1LUG4_9NEOP|nr:Venom carboxylesterase-6 [Frankliniella fusca]